MTVGRFVNGHRFSAGRSLISLAGLVFLAVVLYAKVLPNGFVWDDSVVVVGNSLIRKIFPIARFFAGEGLLKQRPLQSLSLALDYRLWGLNSFGFHLTNLLLHVINCVGVYFLGLHLLRNTGAAFVAGLVFVVHPIHVEAVAALLGRSDLLAAVACLCGFLCYIRARQGPAGVAVHFYILSLVLFGVACLSKETGVVLAGWVALYEFFGLHSKPYSPWRSGLLLLPFGLIAAFYLAFMFSLSGPAIAKTGWWGGTFWSNLLMGFKVFWEYLRLLFFPLRLSPWYVVSVPRGPLDWNVLLGAFGLVAALVCFVFTWLRRSLFGFLLGWYLVCYLPLSNLIPINGSMMAERWLYSASIAFSLGVGWGWHCLVARISPLRRRIAAGLGIVVFVLLGVHTFSGIRIWRSDFSLFGNIVRDHPLISRAHLWLADAYLQADSIREAERHFRIALALEPESPEVRSDLGILYDRQGRYQEAVKEYQTALRLGGESPRPRQNLGIAYEHLGRFSEALVEYQKALSLGAEKSKVYFRMGECFGQLGDTARAREAYALALAADPTFREARSRLTRLPP